MDLRHLSRKIICLTLLVPLLVACGGPQPQPTPVPAISTPVPTDTPIPPTATPTPVLPTATPTPLPPTPTPASGTVKGKLVGKATQKPISGAKVVLCIGIQSEEKKCLLETERIATSIQDGSFSLANIPAGTYVVVYALDKDVDTKPWKGITVNYGPFPLETAKDPFGGNDGFNVSEGFLFTVSRSADDQIVMIPEHGAATSVAFGLTLEFVDGNPVTVQVDSGKTAEVEIRVSGQ